MGYEGNSIYRIYDEKKGVIIRASIVTFNKTLRKTKKGANKAATEGNLDEPMDILECEH